MKLIDKIKFIFGFSIFTIIYIFCIFLGFKRQNIDLSETEKIISIVENRGIDIRYGSKGKKSNVFYIKLKDLNKKLGIPNKIQGIEKKDITVMVKRALSEANPLYPVPRILNSYDIRVLYEQIQE